MVKVNSEYKIVTVKDKKSAITADHRKRELLVSEDIKLDKTDDGKLRATFPNFRPKKSQSGIKKFFSTPKPSDKDCSIVISDPSQFNHCVQKEGIYQLSGAGVTFNGTENDDTLILSETSNSEINMGSGNDTVLYRDKLIDNNKINLGDGNDIFGATLQTDNNRPLINNSVTTGDGHDYVYLRNGRNNIIETGNGNDVVQIDGVPQRILSNHFENNSIDTGKGDDKVDISGNFDKFSKNQFFLGKGDDSFSASINPGDDVQTEFDYQKIFPKYANTVSNNEIYATDGEAGFFEKNEFKSRTYSANQLSEDSSLTACSKGFQDVKIKPVPRSQEVVAKDTTDGGRKNLTREDYTRRYAIGSFGAMLFNSAKMQKMAFKALDDYVQSMAHN